MSREYTKEEARKMLLDQIKVNVDYWSNINDYSDREKLNGLVFSILNIFDGRACLPCFDISIQPHDGDKKYHIENGDNYFKKGMVINDDVMLHEEWYKND